MTIPKAIEILRDTQSTYEHKDWETYIIAVCLGIEALEWEKYQRQISPSDHRSLLPSETKE